MPQATRLPRLRSSVRWARAGPDENHEAAFAHELDDALEGRGEVGGASAAVSPA